MIKWITISPRTLFIILWAVGNVFFATQESLFLYPHSVENYAVIPFPLMKDGLVTAKWDKGNVVKKPDRS